MKALFVSLFFLAGVFGLFAAPTPVSPIYINDEPITPPDRPPQVDALIFENNSLFFVSNNFLLQPLFPSPYNAQSVRFWTNHGVMVGLPGFRFDYTPNPAHLTKRERRRRGANLPQPSEIFFNDGEIIVSDVLQIHAKNVFNPGLLAGGIRARIRINATNGMADLSRGAIHTGELPLPVCASPTNFIFFADPQVNYRYSGSGISGFVSTNRAPFFLPSLATTFLPPNPVAPFAQYRQFTGTNFTTNVQFGVQSCGAYEAFVHLSSNFFGRNISVVFVPTNGLSTNVTVGVAFPTAPFFAGAPIVEFRATDFDVIQQRVVTNYITFRDDGLSIFRGHDCEFDISDPANASLSGDLFYNTQFATNFADYNYTVASAQIGSTNSVFFTNTPGQFVFFPELGRSPTLSDPTNFNGSIHIRAQSLDLTQARLRGENGVFIQTTNLVGNADSFIDAPFINFDATSTNTTLTVSNLARPEVTRIQATLNSWAASWSVDQIVGTNVIGTNTVLITEPVNYHVLILGACVDALHPSILHRLALHATNIVIEDNLAINQALLLEGQSVTFGSNASLTMPRAASVAFTNIVGVTRFTNEGIINVPDGAYFGSFEDGFVQPPPPRRRPRRNRPPPPPRLVTYESFVNHNLVNSASFSARAAYIEHVGRPFAPAVINATNGPARLDGGTMVISNALITAWSDIRLTAGDLLIARSGLTAGSTNGGRFANSFIPGGLIIDATNSLTDGGISSSNEWIVTSGVRVLRRPGNPGDLMGTRIVSRAGTFAEAVHVWPGEDRGATVEGYVNNLAVGRLVLDGASGNSFRFRSATASNAIYIDHLELLNDATNYNFAVNVDPDFTIYFADANIAPEKLDEVGGGRIRWVSQFAGPQSSTNILYPNGVTYTFNAGLVRSRDLDSDGDGIVNGDDCTPIAVPDFDATQPCSPSPALAKSLASSAGDIGLRISFSTDGREVALSWNAAPNSANSVEFSKSLAGGKWHQLTNFVNVGASARVSFKHAIDVPSRIYRVSVDAAKP